MKKIFTIILSFFAFVHANAQISTAEADSNKVVQLNEVVVNGNKKTDQQHLIDFFRSNQSSTLEEVMGRIPEISLMRRGAYGMEASIRSFSSSQVNVLVDGMRIHGACTDRMDPATIYIEPLNLDNLQVQTAGKGFLSGSSIGGTINMKIAEPDFNTAHPFSGSISSGYQTAAKSFYESAKLNYATERWAFRASVTYRNSSNYRSGGGEVIPFSQYEKVNYSLSAKFQQNKYTYYKADLIADDGWNIGYPALPMDVGFATAKIASLSVHHQQSNKKISQWQLKIYANNIRHYMDDTHRPNIAMHMDMPGYSKTAGFYGEAEMVLNKKQRLLFRADASSTYLKASMTMYETGQLPMYMLTWPDNRKIQNGISASWLYQVDSTTRLQLNSRVDYILSNLISQEAKDQISILGYANANRNDLLKNISASVTKDISRKIKTNINISYAERMASASELYGFYLFNSNDNYDYIGNPKLKCEYALAADASVSYNWNKNRIQLNYFYSKIFNYITGIKEPSFSTMTIGANGVKTFINIPYGTMTGVEASAILKPVAAIDFVSTLRYTYANDDQRQPLPLIAPLKNVTSVRYQPNRFSVQLETEAAAKQTRINTKYGEDETAGYVLLNIRFGYNTTLFNNNLSIQTGVENVFDKKYHEHLDWGNIPRPGRNIYVQLKILF